MDALTGCQLETARFVWLFTKRNGFPPTYREIGEAFSVNVHTVQERIKSMRRKSVFSSPSCRITRGLCFTREFRESADYKLMVQVV